MSLWLEGKEGTTVICGCCHSGIINTLQHIKKQTQPTTKITNLFGGLHLVSASQQRLDKTFHYLQAQDIEQYYPAHCTGDEAIRQLSQLFNNRVEIAKSGLKISI
ncbi:hypothetical protein ACLKMH_00650 [Psychromonas sp. KJ10-10]|uniref:hypothetical protein n=1 Tax=Psychromonas sp. KJ10-10 TaxID=3391823 RepID=UPI0039B686E2